MPGAPSIEELIAQRKREEQAAAAAARDEAARQAQLTIEQRIAEQQVEYSQYVAAQPIDHNGARAYNVGDPVPASNVQRFGYEGSGLVLKVGGGQPGVSPNAVPREHLDALERSGVRQPAPAPPGYQIPLGAEPPAKSANKADWVAYASAKDPENAEWVNDDGTTRDQIIAKYGS
ncbi:MAG: hypothetical protein LC798_10830 [Chloroflexi bacterium]|nr:hypothetical protein [Chloroflexota bacterium]